jgi:hypothetical protein
MIHFHLPIVVRNVNYTVIVAGERGKIIYPIILEVIREE